ncbi:T9SS type A sorting domain-containing protein [Hymenobacter glaciei]|uniref:T9SS type A sorting domain-containing protein n=1 Tax=Hymenobacter glaciei TaxID=877209 RepID=UPI0031ECBDDA
MPVELTRFDAAAKGTGVGLSWATASEKNSAYFEVQRSATGEAYEAIGRVAAQGSSSSAREYGFTDARPLAGLAYYRLRQVDTDGTTAYSPVATARRGGEIATIYPNPTADAVMLPASLGSVRYRVLNALGQTLTSGQAAGGDRLDLSTLPKGAFFLELTDTTGRHTQRLTRQ